MKNAEKLIRKILQDFPESRDDDRILDLKVFEHFGLELTPSQRERFLSMPFMLETIRRTRQAIQEKGEYLPSNETTLKRRKLEQATQIQRAKLHLLFDSKRQIFVQV